MFRPLIWQTVRVIPKRSWSRPVFWTQLPVQTSNTFEGRSSEMLWAGDWTPMLWPCTASASQNPSQPGPARPSPACEAPASRRLCQAAGSAFLRPEACDHAAMTPYSPCHIPPSCREPPPTAQPVASGASCSLQPAESLTSACLHDGTCSRQTWGRIGPQVPANPSVIEICNLISCFRMSLRWNPIQILKYPSA